MHHMREQMRSPSADDIFDAFSDVHRRRVLISLLDHNPQSVESLSATSREVNEMSNELLDQFLGGTVKIEGADKASVRLHHEHLPKLDAHGFIEWDRDENEVQKGPTFDEIRPLLVLLEENREALPDDWM